jgi:hypothetical protein
MDLPPDANEDDDVMIPCDMCDTMVRFTDYNQHSIECLEQSRAHPARVIVVFGPSGVMLGGNVAGRDADNYGQVGEDEDEDEVEDEDDGDPDREAEGQAGGDAGADNDGGGARRTGQHGDNGLGQLDLNMLRRILQQAGPTNPNLMHPLAHLMSYINPPDDYEMNLMIGDMLGRVQRGVADVDNHVDVAAAENFDSCDTCPICCERMQDAMEDGSSRRLASIKGCGHVYCDPCIRTWLAQSTKCPVCMYDLGHA